MRNKTTDEMAAVLRAALTCALATLVTLNLIGVIEWPWWIVTAPFWVPLSIAVVAFSVYWISVVWRSNQ